ncbi:MAG TPA: DUF99 family protein [Patescibacteria group bacterium]|nr:DUF99 family protein [Patescibacteria group bacterium]
MRAPGFTHVKKEIRVLGLATGKADTHHVIGVVYRGRLYLDGVMRTRSQGPDLTDDVIEMVTGSSHHPQIRVILIGSKQIGAGARIDPGRLSEEIGKPVITMGLKTGEKFNHQPTQTFEMKKGREKIAISSFNLKKDVSEKILHYSSYSDGEPEVLRIADLLTSSVTNRKTT